jgi:hypothetical protein
VQRTSIAIAIVTLDAAAYCLLSAARGGLADVVGRTRSSVGFFVDRSETLGLIEDDGKFHD